MRWEQVRGPARLKLALDLDKNPRTRRSRQRARRSRPRRAAAQGRRHDHRNARDRGAARDRSRCAPAQRIRHRIETVVGARRFIAGPAGARSRHRGGRRPGAIRGIGDRRVACAAAAESQDVGNRAGCRSAGHRRTVGAGRQGQRQLKGSRRQSRAAVRSQAIRCAGAKHQPVLARLADGQQADLRRSGQRDIRFAAARARGVDP